MRRKNIIVNKLALELEISASSYKLLTILILYSDERGRCYPSIRLIEEKYNMSKSTIIRSFKELEEKQIIFIIRRKKGTGKIDSNEYIIASQFLAESIRKNQQVLEIPGYNWLEDSEGERK